MAEYLPLCAVNNYGDNLLHLSATNGCNSVIEEIFKKKAYNDIDPKNDCGWTPLMQAIRNGNVETVKTLLANGCSPEESKSGGNYCSGTKGLKLWRCLFFSRPSIDQMFPLLDWLPRWAYRCSTLYTTRVRPLSRALSTTASDHCASRRWNGTRNCSSDWSNWASRFPMLVREKKLKFIYLIVQKKKANAYETTQFAPIHFGSNTSCKLKIKYSHFPN